MRIHPFTESGLGYGPFTFVRLFDHGKVSVACDHCGSGLRYEFIVRNAAGKEFGVGCECVRKTLDKGISDPADAAMIKLLREQNEAKREAKREARLAEINRRASEKWEAGAAEREARRLEAEAKKAAFMTAWAPIIEVLEKTNGDFAKGIHWDMTEQLNPPRGRALDICFDIYGKQFGRKNSKKFNQAVDALVDALEDGNWI